MFCMVESPSQASNRRNLLHEQIKIRFGDVTFGHELHHEELEDLAEVFNKSGYPHILITRALGIMSIKNICTLNPAELEIEVSNIEDMGGVPLLGC